MRAVTRRILSPWWAVSVGTLGAATGVLLAVLVLADRVYLRPLGSTSLDSTVGVFAAHVDTARPRELTSYASFAEWRRRSSDFVTLAGYQPASVNVLGDPEPERLRGARVSADFLAVLGSTPRLGRNFDADDYAGGIRVCVIADALWRRRFGADPSIVGTTIRLEVIGEPASDTVTIVGVAPPGFRYPDRTDIWIPFVPSEFFLRNHSGQWFAVVGRLRNGVTLHQATAQLTRVMQDVQTAYPKMQPTHVANVAPLHQVVTEKRRPLVAGLGLAAILLWLSAAASVGSLEAARSLKVRLEDAIRISLGASRATLLREAAIEGGLLGVAAFLVTVMVATAMVRAFATISVTGLERVDDLRLNGPVAAIGFVLVVAMSSALLLASRLQSLRRYARDGARGWAMGRVAGTAQMRIRAVLVVAEIALAVVSMVLAAGVIARVERIDATDLGFVPRDLLTVRIELPSTRYSDAEAAAFFDRALQQLDGISTVSGTAVATDEPLFGQSANPEFTLQLENRPLAPDERAPVLVNGVTPQYFALLQIPLLEGNVEALDGGERRAIVNSAFARRFYGAQSPVGRRFRFGGNNPPWWTIVGVAADTRNAGPLSPAKSTVFMSRTGFNKRGMTLFARISGDSRESIAAIRGALASLDPDVPIGAIRPATELIQQQFADVWIAARCLALVSLAALCFATVGLFGVLAALAVEMKAEIALRTALGARPADVAVLLSRRTGSLTLAGLATGSVVGIMASRLAAVYLGSDAPRPIDVLGINAVVVFIVALASISPIARAIHEDPLETLRGQ